jgi:site-specific recombinase XerC
VQENASHVISLPLFKLNLPERSLFEPQIKQLTEKSFALENRERRIKATKLVERTETASLFIEGLFQASRCHTPDTAVAISRSPKNYKKNSTNKISQHSFRDVVACFNALNDLRHSTASFLVNAGRTLYEVQHILGHTQVKTTQRYAHLSHDTLLDATNSVNTALGGMFMPMVSASNASQVQLVQ